MVIHQANLITQRKWPVSTRGKQARGINKEQLRQSARLKGMLQLQESGKDKKAEHSHLSIAIEESNLAPIPLEHQKQPQEAEHRSNHIFAEQSQKQPPSVWKTFDNETASGITTPQRRQISHWVEKKKWPKEFREDKKVPHLHAQKRSTGSRHSGASFLTFITPTDIQADMSSPYNDTAYEELMRNLAGSYMDDHKLGITEASKKICQMLLDSQQIIPKDTIFDNNIFTDTCRRLRGKNEARIFKDITPLVVPSAEVHASLSTSRSLDIAIESVNEGWNSAEPIVKPRPQPDYAVGFNCAAFSEDQLKELKSLLGDPSYFSYFMGTCYMLFPFFACEVKSGLVGLDNADRQNLHSVTLAVRGIVELFRGVNCAEELHREVLAFSISHDQRTIRITDIIL